MKKYIFTPIQEYRKEDKEKIGVKTFTKFKPKNPLITITMPDRFNELCVRKLNWYHFDKNNKIKL